MSHPEMPAQPTGLHNLRWVGMYAQDGPTQIKPKTLWRSSALLRAHDELADELAELGIKRVVDLRDREERQRAPRTKRGDLDWVGVSIFEDRLAGLQWDTLTDLYAQMVVDHGRQLAAAVAEVAAGLPEPVLVHCTAGKDRTGLVCALVQEIVGVPRAQIEADYVASSDHLGEEYLGDLAALAGLAGVHEIPGERAHRSVATSAEALETAWHLIDDRGGAERYLLDNGLPSEAIDKLRTYLVEH